MQAALDRKMTGDFVPGDNAPRQTGMFFASDSKEEELREKIKDKDNVHMPKKFMQEKRVEMDIYDRIYCVRKIWVVRNILCQDPTMTKEDIKELVRRYAAAGSDIDNREGKQGQED